MSAEPVSQLSALLRGDTRLSSACHWSDLIAAAERHGLLPHLAPRLDTAHLAPALRTELAIRLRTQRAQALALCSELLAIHQLFSETDIPFITLKGPALALQLYGDATVRVCRDLDLLVPIEVLDRAHSVLTRHGYIPEFQLQGRAARGLREQYHDFTFTAPRGTIIELHWKLAQARYAVPFDLDRISHQAMQLDFFGRRLRVLGPEDQLLFLALHGAKHQWRQLDMVLDIATLLCSTAIDMEAVHARASAWQMHRILNLALCLAARIKPELAPFRAALDSATLRLAARVAKGWGKTRPVSTWSTILFDLAVREHIGTRLRVGWNSLAAPGLHDWQLVHLPDRLFPLYYLVRPFRLAGRALQQARHLIQ